MTLRAENGQILMSGKSREDCEAVQEFAYPTATIEADEEGGK